MRQGKRRHICIGLGLVMIILAGHMILRPVSVRAESGTIYACTIHPCYRHPVSGVIEDSGGEAAYATGQGMVEGCVSTAGMLEVTDSGKKYLTMRLSLVDYTADHAFQVQNWGDSDWTDPAVGITGEGSDKNGTTWDITMEVPSEQCVVRGSMMVTPMGRSVIFYLYPDDFTAGDADGANGMKAAMVTGPSDGGAAADSNSPSTGGNASGVTGISANGDGTESGENAADSSTQNSAAGNRGDASGQSAEAGQTPNAADLQAQAAGGGSDPSSAEASSGNQSQGDGAYSNVQGVTSGAVDKNAGLNLSTEEQADETDPEDARTDEEPEDGQSREKTRTIGETIFINVVSGVLIGGILMGLGACIWHFYRKRQSAAAVDPDEYDDLWTN